MPARGNSRSRGPASDCRPRGAVPKIGRQMQLSLTAPPWCSKKGDSAKTAGRALHISAACATFQGPRSRHITHQLGRQECCTLFSETQVRSDYGKNILLADHRKQTRRDNVIPENARHVIVAALEPIRELPQRPSDRKAGHFVENKIGGTFFALGQPA